MRRSPKDERLVKVGVSLKHPYSKDISSDYLFVLFCDWSLFDCDARSDSQPRDIVEYCCHLDIGRVHARGTESIEMNKKGGSSFTISYSQLVARSH